MEGNYKQLARQTFEEQNKARQNPQSFIPDLENMLQHFKGNVLRMPGQRVGLSTNEGPSAVQECIQFLQSQKPMSVYNWSDVLEKAAEKHAKDIGPQGICGHSGSDGSQMSHRIEHYGDWSGTIGENIDFGQNTPREIIISLIIDDGVSSRGHRGNIFSNKFQYTGIAVHNHKQYEQCTVFDYAQDVSEKGKKSDHHDHHDKHDKHDKHHKKHDIDSDKMSKEIHQEQNEVRQHPKSLIPHLEERLKYYDGNVFRIPGEIELRTNEGPGAVIECIEFLKSAKSLHKLDWSDHLAKAAKDHAKDIGDKGITGHTGSDNSSMSDRIERHGKWSGTIGESIDFGSKTGIDVIMSLMIDDGVSSRGHRNNMMNPEFEKAGIYFYGHKGYETCCVIDYSKDVQDHGHKKDDKKEDIHDHGHKKDDKKVYKDFNEKKTDGHKFDFEQEKMMMDMKMKMKNMKFEDDDDDNFFKHKDTGSFSKGKQELEDVDHVQDYKSKSVSTNTKTQTCGNKKTVTITTTTTYTMRDGSSQTFTETNTSTTTN